MDPIWIHRRGLSPPGRIRKGPHDDFDRGRDRLRPFRPPRWGDDLVRPKVSAGIEGHWKWQAHMRAVALEVGG
jgi:hypothetical protein